MASHPSKSASGAAAPTCTTRSRSLVARGSPKIEPPTAPPTAYERFRRSRTEATCSAMARGSASMRGLALGAPPVDLAHQVRPVAHGCNAQAHFAFWGVREAGPDTRPCQLIDRPAGVTEVTRLLRGRHGAPRGG